MCMDFTVTPDNKVGKVEYLHSRAAKGNGNHLTQIFHLQFKQSPVLFCTGKASLHNVVLRPNKV